MSGKRPILVIEDNDDDYELVSHLIAGAKIATRLERVTSGNQAIQRYSNVLAETAPSLVLTDLSMPDGDGFEFLGWAKAQPAFRDTVLVVLSSTRRGADIDRAYGLGAHFFLSKFPTAQMLGALCAAAEKKDLALQARIEPFRREPALRP